MQTEVMIGEDQKGYSILKSEVERSIKNMKIRKATRKMTYQWTY